MTIEYGPSTTGADIIEEQMKYGIIGIIMYCILSTIIIIPTAETTEKGTQLLAGANILISTTGMIIFAGIAIATIIKETIGKVCENRINQIVEQKLKQHKQQCRIKTKRNKK